MKYCCCIKDCNRSFSTLRLLINHMDLWHGHDRNLCMSCGIDDCQFQYNTVITYRKHVRIWHSVHWSHEGNREEPVSGEDVSEIHLPEDDDEPVDTNECSSGELDSFRRAFALQLATMLLKISEKYMLPKSSAAGIFDDIRALFDTYQVHVNSVIKGRLRIHGFSYENDNILCQIFDGQSFFDEASMHFDSDYKFNKYLCENLQLNLPVSWNCTTLAEIPSLCDAQLHDSSSSPIAANAGIENHKVDDVQYIPILSTLRSYLQQPDIWANIFRSKQESEMLCDFTDGSKWSSMHKNNPELTIRLHMYSDELEICNPLGSRKTVHKLACFYFIVGNIETKYWSSLSNIHLALLCKYQTVKEFGYKKVLEPLLHDLQKLEIDGVTVVIDNVHHTLKGTIVSVAGDNLTSHALAGFSTHFSGGRVCRHCMVVYDKLRHVYSEDDCRLRFSDTHRYHVASVQKDASLRTSYGVTGESCFAELNEFDCISCFPPDVMHDILEGVIGIIINLVIKTAIRSKLTTITKINDALKSLQFNKVDSSNKPGYFPNDFVSKNKSLSGKASEKMCLFRILPLLVGEVMTEDNGMESVWTVYLLCREIVEIILSPIVDPAWIPYLQTLISHHHALLAEIAPSCFTPKMHYLVHYPRLMLVFGPLKHLWCMRFEAAHQQFKQYARRVSSFRNVTKTLAERYQRKKCYEFSVGTFQLSSASEGTNDKMIALKHLPLALQRELRTSGNLSQHFRYTKSATVDGEKFTTDSFIVLDLLEAEEIPTFLKIHFILLLHGQWHICGTVYNTSKFNCHLYAYEVVETEYWLVLPPRSAVSTQCLGSFHWKGKEVILPRFKPCKP